VKQGEDASEGTSDRSGKKRKDNKQRREGSLMATAEWKGKRAPTEVTLDYFGKMLEEPCPNHGYPIKAHP
jgi:hypothetical protein